LLHQQKLKVQYTIILHNHIPIIKANWKNLQPHNPNAPSNACNLYIERERKKKYKQIKLNIAKIAHKMQIILNLLSFFGHIKNLKSQQTTNTSWYVPYYMSKNDKKNS